MLLKVILFTICVSTDSSYASNIGLAPDEEYYNKVLPPLYHIDDYGKCQKSGKPFCRVIITLEPSDKNISFSSIWKYIEKTRTMENTQIFRRDELYHIICVEEISLGQSSAMEKIKSSILESYQKRLSHLGLVPILSEVDCIDDDIEINTYDWIVLFGIISYLFLVSWATLQDFWGAYKSDIQQPKRIKNYLQCFSIKNGWNKLTGPDRNIESENLKSFEGLRCYTMCLIIMGHTYCALNEGFKSNPEYFENPSSVLHISYLLFMSYGVQVFFLMSSWLMSYQFLKTFANENIQKTRYVVLSILNRYLRLIPLLTIMMIFIRTSWASFLYDGPMRRLFFLKEQERCLKNWWANVLLINNIYDYENMCYMTSWHMAADFQLYVLSMLLLFSAWLLRLNFKTVISLFFLFGVIIQSTVVYVYSTDFLFRFSPKTIKMETFLTYETNRVYSSTYSNIASYAIGLGFGYFYYNRNKYTDFINSAFFRFFSKISFLVFTSVVFLLSYHRYNEPVTCILAGITKPLIAFGLGVGILGLSSNVSFCLLKYLLEFKPAIILGRLSFSTYIAHAPYVYSHLFSVSKPTFVTNNLLLTWYMREVVVSFFLGLLGFLLVEQPMLQLQNLVIPQTRNEGNKIFDGKNYTVKDE